MSEDILERLRGHLADQNDDQLLIAWAQCRHLLDALAAWPEDERSKLAAAIQRAVQQRMDLIRKAIVLNDDQAIADNYVEIPELTSVFQEQELRRVRLAIKRVTASRRLFAELEHGHDEAVLAVYEAEQDVLRPLLRSGLYASKRAFESMRRALAAQMAQAVAARNAEQVLAIGEKARSLGVALPEQELTYIREGELARRTIRRLQDAIMADEDFTVIGIANSVSPSLWNWIPADLQQHITLARRRIQLWSGLRNALMRNDDRCIVRNYQPDVLESSRLMTAEQRRRCEVALLRVQALNSVRQAVQAGDVETVIRVCEDGILDRCPLLTSSEVKLIEQVKQAAHYRMQITEAVQSQDPLRIVAAYEEAAQAEANLDLLDDLSVWQTIQDSKQLVHTLSDVRQALQSPQEHSSEILQLGSYLLYAAAHLLTPDETDRLRDLIQQIGQRVRSSTNLEVHSSDK